MLRAAFQDTIAGLPASTVRDTVEAIVAARAYDRSVTKTLWQSLGEWLARALDALLALLPDVIMGRWLLAVLAILLVALVVARIALDARARRESWVGERERPGGRRTMDPWREAHRLAAEGSYLAAAHQLCLAALAASARRGEVTLDPAKTTGDYAREMRRRGAASERAFQRFRARYDRVVYDAQACSAEEFARLLDDATPLLDQPARAA